MSAKELTSSIRMKGSDLSTLEGLGRHLNSLLSSTGMMYTIDVPFLGVGKIIVESPEPEKTKNFILQHLHDKLSAFELVAGPASMRLC